MDGLELVTFHGIPCIQILPSESLLFMISFKIGDLIVIPGKYWTRIYYIYAVKNDILFVWCFMFGTKQRYEINTEHAIELINKKTWLLQTYDQPE
jgi:hypothetical protein